MTPRDLVVFGLRLSTQRRVDGEENKQSKHRQEHRIEPSEPGRKSYRAERNHKRRREATNCGYNRPDDAYTKKSLVSHQFDWSRTVGR